MEDQVDDSQPKSVKDLMKLFSNNASNSSESTVTIKRTVIDEGNIGKTGKNAPPRRAQTTATCGTDE